MRNNTFLRKVVPLTALIISAAAIQTLPAYADTAATSFTNPVGNFDAGVIDTTNLIQFKEYEFKASEENKEKHKDSGEIIMNKELQTQVDQLPNKEASFILNSITFKGYTAFTEEELMNLICDRIGTRVTVGDLVGLTNMVTEHYQKHGYISSVAYLAPQRVQDGNIVINIMEGKYGNVKVSGNKWNRTSYLNNQFLRDKYIESGSLLNVNDIRESLKELNASGYMHGSISLEDNEESAELTDLELTVKDRFPLDFDFRWDDMGTSATGLHRAVFFAGLYNLTGFGDQLYSTTTLARHSIGQGVMYSVPLTATKETKLNVGYSYSGASVAGGGLDFLDLESKSHNLFFTLSRRLIKTDNYKLYGDIGFDLRNTETTWLGGMDLYKYRSRNLKVNLTNIKDDFYGKWFANVGTSVGLDWFGATNQLDFGMEGAYKHSIPSNKGVRVMGNIARIQVLPFRSTGIIQARGQWASRALLPSERMSFGGMSSVRGYEESFFIKDYGATASAELRFPVPFLRMMLPEKLKFIDDSIRLAGFYDIGWFGNRHASNDGPDYLMSVGGGVILKLTRYLSANVYLGVPIGDKPENASGCRVHFIVTSNIL